MKHGSLFSGIGGFDLAAQWMGWENVFHCENDKWCKNKLKQLFPNSKQYDDIRNTDFTIYRGSVNIISGGFPCQDISVASSNGKKGLDGEKSGLWFEMLRAITEIGPDWVVCENVYGLINQGGGMAIETVCAGMESQGYEVLPPIVIPAIAAGANHLRKRVWIIAHSTSLRDRISKREVQAGRDITKHNDWWDSEPGVCRVYDGLPQQLDKNRLRALGNAIVPQVALNIFRTIEAYESAINQPET